LFQSGNLCRDGITNSHADRCTTHGNTNVLTDPVMTVRFNTPTSVRASDACTA
jgi:hypothetical protein